MYNAIKMMCSDCGAEMNHHADKIDYAANIAEPTAAAAIESGGVVQEIHSCPDCGRTDVRLER